MYIKEVTKQNLKPDLPQLRSGQTVRVHQRIKEPVIDIKTGKIKEYKERTQAFEGQIIALKHGRGLNATVTIRRIASGVGVERIFPVHSPTVAKIEIIKNARAKKAKLYYTREGKEAKVLAL
ncbi:MAG: 50S ribosomal protein L19 [Candidatus Doudnabacteria bacterium]|nr:50S ribosomal protein L19 [Candidatus Doudnabacteria bacterium]